MRYPVLMLAALMMAAPVHAQEVDGKGIPYRAWDVDAGVGVQAMEASDRNLGGDLNRTGWNWSWAGTVEVGHYWTSHLKTSAGLTLLQPNTEFESSLVTVAPGVQGYAYTVSDVNRAQLSLAATWQFLDNVFMHPYISVGARALVMDVSAHRDPFVTVFAGNTSRRYPIEGGERDYTAVRTRPFVAFGSKSYFTERTFVRPEMLLAFNNKGASQFSARLAFGVDF